MAQRQRRIDQPEEPGDHDQRHDCPADCRNQDWQRAVLCEIMAASRGAVAERDHHRGGDRSGDDQGRREHRHPAATPVNHRQPIESVGENRAHCGDQQRQPRPQRHFDHDERHRAARRAIAPIRPRLRHQRQIGEICLDERRKDERQVERVFHTRLISSGRRAQ